MTYRNDIEALAERHAALANEVQTKTRELDDARRILDEAQARARRPILPNIKVASPCNADWNQMTGDERTRMCGSCNKNVYNLSSMTREEAEALILEKEGKLCVRYFQRKDGTILLKDCAVGTAQRRKRRIIAAGAATLLAGGGVFLALRDHRKPAAPTITHRPQDYPVMGEMAVAHEPDVVEPVQDDPDWREVKGDIAAPPEHHVKMGKIAIHPDDLK
ncbi:MAG TPA: hypothetical protein VLB44_17060 [Kofleriaceae bacterium]|nr:hypothetical protein [Kofleriaceae bacterium]